MFTVYWTFQSVADKHVYKGNHYWKLKEYGIYVGYNHNGNLYDVAFFLWSLNPHVMRNGDLSR